MNIFRKKNNVSSEVSVPADGPAEDAEAALSLPEDLLAAIPEDQRGGPFEELMDGRYVIVGRDILMVADSGNVVDSGFWHEVQYCSWDAQTRQFRLVWSQPERPMVEGRTRTTNPEKLMRKITLCVDSTIVATRRFVTSTGVSVAATVRRRVDGELFSAVFVSGMISEADQQKAFDLEQALREELGVEG